MQRMLPAALMVAVLGAGGCTAGVPRSNADAMLAAAKALDAEFLAAFNQADVETMAGLYADSADTAFFPPDAMVARGVTGVREVLANTVKTMGGGKLELIEQHDIVLADAVASWGLWRYTGTGPDGAPMTMEGRYTDVKAERDGKWVYLVDHASVPMAPPEVPMGGQNP